MTPEQETKLNEVYDFVQSLKNSTTIPLEVDTAFRERLTSISGLVVSGKTASSEDVSINEGGLALHTVLDDPVGFLQIDIGSATYYLPYYAA